MLTIIDDLVLCKNRQKKIKFQPDELHKYEVGEKMHLARYHSKAKSNTY